MEFTLEVTKRERTGKHALASLRDEGFIPGVIYGAKEEATSVKVNAREFVKTLKGAGESTIVTLKGLDKDKDVLIHDVDFEPVKGDVRHVDFYAVDAKAKIHVAVPLEFVGEAPAVKGLGGVLTKVLHEVEVETLPKDLPQHIEADISLIVDFSTSLHVSDLKFPEGVVPVTAPEEVVAAASAAVEEEEAPAEGPDMDAIEVEEKGKKEDGEGADAPAEGGE